MSTRTSRWLTIALCLTIPAAIVLIGSVVAAGGVLSAQRARGRWGRLPEGPGVPVRYAQPGFEDGAFTVCKVQYTSVRYEDMGVGWATDYPYAGINLMQRMSELTDAAPSAIRGCSAAGRTTSIPRA